MYVTREGIFPTLARMSWEDHGIAPDRSMTWTAAVSLSEGTLLAEGSFDTVACPCRVCRGGGRGTGSMEDVTHVDMVGPPGGRVSGGIPGGILLCCSEGHSCLATEAHHVSMEMA